MIKINKDLTAIPNSLKPPIPAFFPKGTTVPRPSETTHRRRLEVIAKGKYVDHKNYNSRYKSDDIKIALNAIYRNKCAFCEQRVELTHVEHYRPKSIYYWLAYSWDNLLIACPACNFHKKSQFEINGSKAVFLNTTASIRDIHKSRSFLDASERPKMVNPEVINPLGRIRFTDTGWIDSDDPNFSYTIDACKLSRPDLCDQRRKIIDDFRKDIIFILTNTDPENQETAISAIIKQFIRRSKDVDANFLAFRTYAIDKNWLGEIVKGLN